MNRVTLLQGNRYCFHVLILFFNGHMEYANDYHMLGVELLNGYFMI